MNEGGKDERDEKDRWQEPIVLDARDLRDVAENYASLRGPKGDRYFFVQEGSPGRGTLKEEHDPQASPPDGTVFQLNASAQQPNRPKVVAAKIWPEDGDEADLMAYDAVFWSESAVEKFVFPYYASKAMWRAAYLLTKLTEQWYRFVPGPGTDAAEEEQEKIPFAIGHVPDSQFVPIAEGSDLHLLTRKNGKVYARSLAELIAEREAEDR